MHTAFVIRRLSILFSLAAVLLAPVRAVHAQQSACVAVTGANTGADSAASAQTTRSALLAARDTTHTALRLLASASADEVRFVGSPKVCVRLTGDAQLDSVRVLARRNLASPVVSGTTYRNVYIAVEILGRLNAECITGRLTGAASDSSRTTRCASLGVQGGAGATPP